jgi:hypothetical protein
MRIEEKDRIVVIEKDGTVRVLWTEAEGKVEL